MSDSYSRIRIAGIPFDNLTLEEAIIHIKEVINAGGFSQIVTPNIDHLALAQKDDEFFKILNSAELSVADGMGVVYLSRILRTPIKENVGGRLLFMEICRYSVNVNWKLFFLGSKGSIAGDSAKILQKQIPRIQIVGAISPSMKFCIDDKESDEIVEEINSSKADILLVGVGSPKTEKWIYLNKNRLKVHIALVMGYGFDLIVGKVKRPPNNLTEYGFEWLFRLIKDPRNLFERYLIRNIPFFIRFIMNNWFH